jgi:hypothetical protein
VCVPGVMLAESAAHVSFNSCSTSYSVVLCSVLFSTGGDLPVYCRHQMTDLQRYSKDWQRSCTARKVCFESVQQVAQLEAAYIERSDAHFCMHSPCFLHQVLVDNSMLASGTAGFEALSR